MSVEVSSHIQRAWLVFTSLEHLWCRRDIRFSIRVRVRTSALGSALLYESETWPLGGVRKVSIFEHSYLLSIDTWWWEVRRKVSYSFERR